MRSFVTSRPASAAAAAAAPHSSEAAISPLSPEAAALAWRRSLYLGPRLPPPVVPRRRGQPPGLRTREQVRVWVERELRAAMGDGDVSLLSHFVVTLHEGAF